MYVFIYIYIIILNMIRIYTTVNWDMKQNYQLKERKIMV